MNKKNNKISDLTNLEIDTILNSYIETLKKYYNKVNEDEINPYILR